MIRSFKDGATEAVWNMAISKRIGKNTAQKARTKMQVLDAATSIQDLRIPPGNHLEKLKGERRGQHSIRVNDQYRICFIWADGGAEQVELTDYH